MNQGDDRADRLAVHHNLVIGLIPNQSLPMLLAYNIKACELSAKDAQHDLAVLDSWTLGRAHAQSFSQLWRGRSLASEIHMPKPVLPTEGHQNWGFRRRAAECPIRCGSTGHFTTACTAKSMSAGKPCTSMFQDAGQGKVSPQSLTSPMDHSRAFCVSWA